MPVSGLDSLLGFQFASAATALAALVGLLVSLVVRISRFRETGERIGLDDRVPAPPAGSAWGTPRSSGGGSAPETGATRSGGGRPTPPRPAQEQPLVAPQIVQA
ncbi:MAG: hypothetical protein ACRECR_06210 [Thermoplasmata archaeon]